MSEVRSSAALVQVMGNEKGLPKSFIQWRHVYSSNHVLRKSGNWFRSWNHHPPPPPTHTHTHTASLSNEIDSSTTSLLKDERRRLVRRAYVRAPARARALPCISIWMCSRISRSFLWTLRHLIIPWRCTYQFCTFINSAREILRWKWHQRTLSLGPEMMDFKRLWENMNPWYVNVFVQCEIIRWWACETFDCRCSGCI
jgi:hypothetical protein